MGTEIRGVQGHSFVYLFFPLGVEKEKISGVDRR